MRAPYSYSAPIFGLRWHVLCRGGDFFFYLQTGLQTVGHRFFCFRPCMLPKVDRYCGTSGTWDGDVTPGAKKAGDYLHHPRERPRKVRLLTCIAAW